MPCSAEERALADAIRAGNVGALERFVSCYARVITAELRAIGARPGYDLEDLVQEVLIAASGQLRDGRYAGRSALSTWLYAIARRRMVDRWRFRSRGVAPVGLLHAPSRKFTGPLSLADQDAAVLLEEAIAALPAREALVFRRCCLDGTDIRTVAEESGRSPSRIYADLADAKQRIHDALTS